MHFELGSVLPVQIAIRFRGEIRGVPPPPQQRGQGVQLGHSVLGGCNFVFLLLHFKTKSQGCLTLCNQYITYSNGDCPFSQENTVGGKKTNKHAPWREL